MSEEQADSTGEQAATRPKIPPEAGARKKRPVAKGKKKAEIPEPRSVEGHGWMLCGFDVSMSSIAGAAITYDKITDKHKGPTFVIKRWSKEDHYFDRLKFAAMAHELVLDLQSQLSIGMAVDEVFISQEEPFPPHGKFMAGGASGFLKQQAEISGAFLGGLLRYGYRELWQMGNMTWRKVIADDLGITTHHTKWKSPELAQKYNAIPKDSGKFRAKQWSSIWSKENGKFQWEIPDWPDIIESSKLGKIPRPEDSKAKAIQPDDRYDALAILWALYLDMHGRGKV